MILKGKSAEVLIFELEKKCKLKMSKSAFYRKLKGISEFDRKEILAIAKVLALDDEKILEIFFKEKCPKGN